MTNLNIQQLSQQLASFSAEQLREWPVRRKALAEARKALRAYSDTWHKQLQDRVRVPWLMARPLEDPTCAIPPGARPTPLTAVAADGSQIYPDQHIEPLVYLLNISQIAFQYGTLEKPVMSTITHVGPEREEFRAPAMEAVTRASADVVSARRDQMELEALLSLALRVQQPDRPIIAMADGSLIRWMLQRIEPAPLKDELIRRYARQLAAFRTHRIPLCSFISMPNSTEVVNLLRGLRGEPHKVLSVSFAGILDRSLYDAFLGPWERTALFASASHVLEEYHALDRVCFFYMRVLARHGESEIARVEVPRWVACEAALLRLVHAAIAAECEKQNGYPMILAEAHQRVVVRSRDRRLFYSLLEREMRRHNLGHRSSHKRAAKQRPVV